MKSKKSIKAIIVKERTLLCLALIKTAREIDNQKKYLKALQKKLRNQAAELSKYVWDEK